MFIKGTPDAIEQAKMMISEKVNGGGGGYNGGGGGGHYQVGTYENMLRNTDVFPHNYTLPTSPYFLKL